MKQTTIKRIFGGLIFLVSQVASAQITSVKGPFVDSTHPKKKTVYYELGFTIPQKPLRCGREPGGEIIYRKYAGRDMVYLECISNLFSANELTTAGIPRYMEFSSGPARGNLEAKSLNPLYDPLLKLPLTNLPIDIVSFSQFTNYLGINAAISLRCEDCRPSDLREALEEAQLPKPTQELKGVFIYRETSSD